MTTLTIGIDGYNLAMPGGTGVATYGVALGEAVRAAGHRLDGVFGLAGPRRGESERWFGDRFDPAMAGGRRGAAAWLGRKARRTFTTMRLRADEVPLDAAPAPLFGSRLPRFDRIVNASHLFERAHHGFARHSRFLELRMAAPPTIMHWTYPVPIRIAGTRNVYTIHDIVPLILPQATLDRKPLYHALLARCVASGDHICTVSETSRADIVRAFGVAADRVTNTYQTAGAGGAADARDGRDVAASLGLAADGYFLFYGALEPKKNVGRLIEAYLSTNSATPLVLVSGRRWLDGGEAALLAMAERDGAVAGVRRGRIVRIDYLPRARLDALIRAARAVVFPSLYEGFGLPVLEAMRSGTAVLTSAIGATAEIAGDAAMLVDPYDVRSIADGLRALDSGPDRRAALRAAGLKRAEEFGEARYVERLDRMYAAVLAAKPVP